MSGRLIGFMLVLGSAALEACGQVFLKNSASAQATAPNKKLWFSGGIACFAVEALVWSCVLRTLEVSIAYPMGSLSFVAITLLCWLFLKERIARERWIGVVLIIGGTALVGLG